MTISTVWILCTIWKEVDLLFLLTKAYITEKGLETNHTPQTKIYLDLHNFFGRKRSHQL